MTVYDRWWKTERQPNDIVNKVRSSDYGCKARWQVRWRDESGKQRKRAFEKKARAESFDAQIKAQLDSGMYVDPSAGRITFKKYAEQWRASRAHDAPTAQRIEYEFRLHVYPVIGDHQIQSLAKRPSLIQAWVGGIKRHPNSVRQIVKDASQVFTAALDDGIITRNPLKARSVQLPKVARSEAVPWTSLQVAAVAAHLPQRFNALPYLGVGCGMRQGELFAVALEDLDFPHRTVRVEYQVRYVARCLVFAPVKNRRSRLVPVPAPVIPIMSEHVRLHPPAAVTLPWLTPDGKPVTRTLLFTRPDGSPLMRPWFNNRWRAAWQAAGIPDNDRKNGCHVLRHTAASVWLSQGLSIAKVAEYLGDTKEVVLQTYAHFMPDDDERARKIMNVFLEGIVQASCALNVPRRVGG